MCHHMHVSSERPIKRRAKAFLLAAAIMLLTSTFVLAQNAKSIRGAASVVPLSEEPPPKLIVDPPLPGPLSQGRIVIQYSAINIHIVPVFGEKALEVSPRIGHIHVTVDDLPWHWADASGEPIIMNGLAPGPHKALIELVNANHKPLESSTVVFVVPDKAVGRKAR